jgi:hypothetical protein
LSLLFVAVLAPILASASNALPVVQDERLAVVVGNNLGLAGEHPLAYAERDARQFHRLLVEVAGVREDRAYLVVGQKADVVRNVITEARGRVMELAAQGPTSMILYVSSHADAESLHFSDSRLPIAELRALVADVPANLRLVIVDACRTPVRSLSKGGKPGPSIDVAFSRSDRVKGQAFIFSSSLGEPAQEWVFLRGALFTHHLMSALRGLADADMDGRISLAEAYTYAFRRTSAQAAMAQGHSQHPSFDLDMEGVGDWFFSEPSRLDSVIELDPDLDGTWWVANRGNELVAEVSKQKGRSIRIAVKPGWYRVASRQGDYARAADLNLQWGGTRTISAADLARVPMRTAVLRGGKPILLRPWRLTVGYELSGATLEGLSALHGFEMGVRGAWQDWIAQVRASYTQSSFPGQRQTIDHTEWRLGLGAGREWPVFVSMVGLGLELRTTLAQQRLTRDGQQDLKRIFGLKNRESRAVFVGGGAFLTCHLPLWGRFWLRLQGYGGLQHIPFDDREDEVRPYVGATFGLAADL